MRYTIVNSVKVLFKKFNQTPFDEGLLALEDELFKVEQDEVVDIIGRNGAGKSTLLKILSRITASTLETVELQGWI
jgi:lipopolysaccharide transport system ATP-binding protein